MKKFKLIPAIYLYKGQVVDKNTKEIIGDGDGALLATYYGNVGADELLVFDISETDDEHDANISAMIRISDEADIPMIVGGKVNRLEDVKKYLYSGAKKAMLDVSKQSNLNLIKDASDRFGKDKIALYIPTDINDVNNIILDDASLIVSGQFVKTNTDLLLIDNNYSEDKIIEFSKTNSLYGISTSDMNCDFDYMSEKTQLKNQGISTDIFETKIQFSDFKKNADGMIPVIVQDYKTNEVLMLAYMNEEAFEKTIKTGMMTYYSRSRDEIWIKGETSGHYQYVKELKMDCDLDTMLANVHQVGVPCHTGKETCFFNELVKKEYNETNPMKVFEDVYNVILDRKEHPKEGSYTNYLFDKGIDKILKKVGEEATEIVIAAKNPDPQEIKYEISDFLYHIMVLMALKGVSWKEIVKELSRR